MSTPEQTPWAKPEPVTDSPVPADNLEDTIPLPAYRPERLI